MHVKDGHDALHRCLMLHVASNHDLMHGGSLV